MVGMINAALRRVQQLWTMSHRVAATPDEIIDPVLLILSDFSLLLIELA